MSIPLSVQAPPIREADGALRVGRTGVMLENEDVLRAWRQRMPNCDVLTVYDAQLSGVSDDEIADWA